MGFVRDKKILYVSFDVVPSPKGASTHITNFLKGIVKKYNTTLITLSKEDFCRDYFSARHIGVMVNSSNFLKRTVEFAEEVKRHIIAEKYDIVHFRSIWEGVSVCYLKNIFKFKTIYEVNGFPSIELKYHYPEIKKNKKLLQKLKLQEKYCLENSDFIITPSNVTKKFITSYGIDEKKIKVIPNGVDPRLFRPENFKKKEIKIKILYTGTLSPWQGIDTLLKAFLILQNNNYSAELLILETGRKEWLKEYQKNVRKLGVKNVHFLKPVPHEKVPEIINNSDICVAPLSGVDRNLVQGCCPIKIFEYLACKKTVVASDIEVNREILEHHKDALLYQPDSSEALANCLIRLINDKKLRNRIKKCGYQKVKKFYSWGKIQKELLKIYKYIEKNVDYFLRIVFFAVDKKIFKIYFFKKW